MVRAMDTWPVRCADLPTRMTRPERYTDTEHAALRGAFLNDGPLECPSGHGPLDRRPVPPRSDVSYVQERLWVSCPVCHRSTVLDRREPR